MRVLVACEYSGTVRDAFRSFGHEAYSCDVLDGEGSSTYHVKDDVIKHLNDGWDLMIAHPPCTHIAVSGCRHFDKKIADGRQQAAIDFFMELANCDIPKICIENPVCIMSSKWRKPDQYVHPYYFGDATSKKTGLWLKGLPLLTPTNMVIPETAITKNGRVFDKWWLYTSGLPLSIRGRVRSKTFQGLANAMASQWGGNCQQYMKS